MQLHLGQAEANNDWCNTTCTNSYFCFNVM